MSRASTPSVASARKQNVDGRTSPAMTATNVFPPFWASPANSQWPACFPALLAPNRDREIGGGRATRQPGQVRKEAALTRSGSGRSSVSYLFFRANRAHGGKPAHAVRFRSL